MSGSHCSTIPKTSQNDKRRFPRTSYEHSLPADTTAAVDRSTAALLRGVWKTLCSAGGAQVLPEMRAAPTPARPNRRSHYADDRGTAQPLEPQILASQSQQADTVNKVQGGTPQGTESKCVTCRFAHRIEGVNLQRMVHCQWVGKPVPFQVYTCSSYDDKRLPSLDDMRRIAWTVETRNRGAMGFSPTGQLEVEISPPKPQQDYPPQPGAPTVG